MKSRFGWALGGALLLGFILVLARGATAGSLDPPGPVGSTMRTLDELLPAWNKTLPATGGCDSQRFDCVLAAEVAVHDRETGLVWDRAPDGTNREWDAAFSFCAGRTTGGRQGWRLPSQPELQSLLDGTTLPAGHPFTVPIFPTFWTSTPAGSSPDEIFAVFFSNGTTQTRTSNSTLKSWCVRGPGANDGSAVERRNDPFGSWDSVLSSTGPVPIDPCVSFRFRCVMGGAAVLDLETGLVWQQTPNTTPIAGGIGQAQTNCVAAANTGGRNGWRLPTASELYSLRDESIPDGQVALPAGHPFNAAAADVFWTSDPWLSNTDAFMVVDFLVTGGSQLLARDRNESFPVWCVRGPE